MIIAIDPGKKTGIAIIDKELNISLHTTDFWGAIDIIEDNPKAFFIVELPETKHVWHIGAKSRNAISRTGVNVGSCIREAELIIKYLARREFEYVINRPLGKTDKNVFARITGYQLETNPHERDAGMLAWSYKEHVFGG